MNLVFDRIEGRLVHRRVTELDSFQDIDDALYYHERPYYHYCARGIGNNPIEDQAWCNERARLTALWHSKCTYRTDVDPTSVIGTGLWKKVVRFFGATV